MRLGFLVAFVVLTAVLAGCSAKAPKYPDAYLLKSNELPEGLKLSEVPEEMKQFGFNENPAQVPAQALQMMGDEFADFIPESVWLEMVEPTTSSSEFGADGGLLIAPGFWTDESKAQGVIDTMKSQPDEDVCGEVDKAGTLLRDRNVIVIIAGDESMSAWIPKITSALQEKAPGLADVC